jgi:purine-binding chemotaxis protein CheW
MTEAVEAAGPVPGRDRETVEEARDLLVLRVGGGRFGLWIDEVLEVVATPPLSRLPLASAEVPGVTSVRGDIVPVLDLGVRLQDEPLRRGQRLVLVRDGTSGSIVGLLADGVETLLTVTASEVREVPAALEARLPPGLAAGVVAREEAVVVVLHKERAAAPPVASSEGR